MIDWIRKNNLYSAWVISLFGLFLSLFVGEILDVEPCNLCWYQRIALFPLAILLGIAAYKDDQSIVPYALPLACIGAAVALYQTIGQKLPFLFGSATCGYAEECAAPVFSLFGFITFPLLSAAGFALISFLLYTGCRNR